MKVVLCTSFEDAPSTALNRILLESLHDFSFSPQVSNFDADIVLFMGYDPQIDLARYGNPDALIGIIDPRPGSEEQLKKADFYLANGIEMVNYFAGVNHDYFIYPIYTPIKSHSKTSISESIIHIGYHGNRAHLELMETTVCEALERLSKDVEIGIQLSCIYNHKKLGKWSWHPKSKNIVVNHIQWTESIYVEVLPNLDIGIVPNLIPFQPENSKFDNELQSLNLSFDSDMKFRFKPTSNLGRILVFAQLGIPVIADMYPSSAEIIQHGYNGLLATDVDSWYMHLKRLIQNTNERKNMGQRINKVFKDRYHRNVKNQELLEFFTAMVEKNSHKKLGVKERIKKIFS